MKIDKDMGSILGPELKIDGNVKVTGSLLIYGTVNGNIESHGSVRTARGSKVKGDIDIKSEARFLEGENITKELTFLTLTTPIFAGMEYPLWGNTKLILELGYDHGWTSISNQIKGEDGKMSKRRNVTMSYLSFNTGILF